MKEFDFVVSTPTEGETYQKVQSVFMRGAEGDITILSGHVPFVTIAVKGTVKMTLSDGTVLSAETEKGILSVDGEKTTLVTAEFKKID